MAINKVDLTVSQLVNDLNTGLTWYKKDDLGYGSIEAKYGATPPQIMAIRKHPALKDAETNVTIFNIIDDTKNETLSTTQGSLSSRTDKSIQQPALDMVSREEEVATSQPGTIEAADIFAQL